MKGIISLILLTNSITSFADIGVENIDGSMAQEGKSTFFGYLTKEGRDRRNQQFNSYNGAEINGLKRGMKTFFINVDNSNWIVNKLAPGAVFREQILVL